MARFRIFVTGSPQPIDVDLPVGSITELSGVASRSRFLEGHVADADSDGIYAGVLIPTYRIQFIIETS
jgi:hypothetical protein